MKYRGALLKLGWIRWLMWRC